ncbi:ATP-binding cassette domain-containing protein, partial [bacterium]|nr:ATP-binding cassette domain-containing protein [bacterium]
IMGLGDKLEEMPANLSGGMRKRVAIARTLTMNPDVILYDEPTAGLDPPRANSIDDLIQEMADRTEVTSVIVTHDLVSAFSLADIIYFIHKGKVLTSGTPDEIRDSDNETVQTFIHRH